MSFKSKYLRVVKPLDLDKGNKYVELLREELNDFELNNFYKVTVWCEDYINPIVDGKLSWTSIISCSFDSNDAFEN